MFLAILAVAQSTVLYLGLSLKTVNGNLGLKVLNEIHFNTVICKENKYAKYYEDNLQLMLGCEF